MVQSIGEAAGKVVIASAALLLAAVGCVGLIGSMTLNDTELKRARRQISAEDALSVARGWVDVPGIGSPARGLIARVTTDAPDIPVAEQRADARTFLSGEPANSEAWLGYANIALISGEPVERVQQIYRQSFLTGRFEGRLFLDRALFAMAAWSIIPDDLRRTALSQLLSMRAVMNPSEYTRLTAFLRILPPETREGLDPLFHSVAASEADHAWLRGLQVEQSPVVIRR